MIRRAKGPTHAAVEYTSGLLVDVWKSRSSNAPALAVLHGGSWATGSRTDALYQRISALFWYQGFSVFNADYTLSGAQGFTSQKPIDDTLALVQFIRTNAATYNVNSTRVAALGISAGGHLVLMAGITGTASTTRPDAMVSWSGPGDLGELVQVADQEHVDLLEAYIGAPYSGNEALYDAKSPTLIWNSNSCPVRIVGSVSEINPPGGILNQAHYDDMEAAAIAAIGSGNVSKLIFEGNLHGTFDGALPHPDNGTTGPRDDVAGSANWIKSEM